MSDFTLSIRGQASDSTMTETTHDVTTCDVYACMKSAPGPDSATFRQHVEYLVEPFVESEVSASTPTRMEIETVKDRLRHLLQSTTAAMNEPVDSGGSRYVLHDRKARHEVAKSLQDFAVDDDDYWRSIGETWFANRLGNLRHQEEKHYPERRTSSNFDVNSDTFGSGGLEFLEAGDRVVELFERAASRAVAGEPSLWVQLQG